MKKTETKKTTVKSTAKKVANKTATKKVATKKTTAKVATKKVATKKTVKKTATKKAVVRKATTKKPSTKKVEENPQLEMVMKCWKALDDKKAENLRILDVTGRSPITNYFILATATSEPHLKALAGEIEKTLKENGVKSVGRDFKTSSGWVVVDAFDFMAHIFLPEQRGLYGIESLWKDADEIRV